MAVTFYLRRMSRKKLPENTDNLPEIKGYFAFTAYPSFFRCLADDSGLGSLWTEYRKVSSANPDKIWVLAQAANGAGVGPDQKAKVLCKNRASTSSNWRAVGAYTGELRRSGTPVNHS